MKQEPTQSHLWARMILEHLFRVKWADLVRRQKAAGGEESALQEFGLMLLKEHLPMLARGDLGALRIPLALPLRMPNIRKLA